MEKLQVRLMVLLVLGTISSCEEVGGPHFDSVSVVTSLPTPPFGCGPRRTVDVRFNEIKVMGDGSDVVYRRATVTDWHIQFAMNATVSLPSDGFVECAKAVAKAGLEAFVFGEKCTGYQLNYRFIKCLRSDIVVFVRSDSFAEEPTVVPFDEAPYRVIDNGVDDPYRLYMLSAFVEVSDDLPNFTIKEEFDEDDVSESRWNVVFLENGDFVQMRRYLLDVDFCLTDGSYGLPVALSYELYDAKWPVVYFFEKCGETVQFPYTDFKTHMLVLSHPGFGCKYYPSDLPDECTVTFKSDDTTDAYFGFYFSEPISDHAGLIMTITGIKPHKEDTMDMYKPNFGYDDLPSFYDTYNVSLQRQPSKRAIGFFINFL